MLCLGCKPDTKMRIPLPNLGDHFSEIRFGPTKTGWRRWSGSLKVMSINGKVVTVFRSLPPRNGVHYGGARWTIHDWSRVTRVTLWGGAQKDLNRQRLANAERRPPSPSPSLTKTPPNGASGAISEKKVYTKAPKNKFPSSTKELMFSPRSPLTAKDTALLSAAKGGKLVQVQALLAEGVAVDVYDEFGCTALFWAAANNHAGIVELLIEKKAYLEAGTGIAGTPLSRAAYDGHLKIVKLLIASGANVNAKDGTGRTPLSTATDEAAEILRKHGAKP